MRKLILSCVMVLIGLTISAQESNPNEPVIEFDVFKNLYLVYTDEGNYHYVSEDGELNGEFMHTFNNVTVKGYMKNGKRHGTLITYIDGKEDNIIKYVHGRPVAVTNIIE